MRSSWIVVLSVVLLGTLGMPAAYAGEIEESGRAILQKNRDAVVTVQLLCTQRMSMAGMGSQEEESKVEATGFVIGADGLTVLSLSQTDPSAMFKSMMSAEMDFKIETDISDVKLLLTDGTELPAAVVLRDVDLDLAFVRPKEKPAEPMTTVDLSKSAAPELLDAVIALNRLGRVAGRAYSVSIERIESIIKRPRTLYVPGNDPTHSALGSPVFTLDGKVVGMIALRMMGGDGGGGFGGGMMGQGMQDNLLAVVVPAEDILEGARQAAAVGEEKKEEGAEQ
ncbi:MAG: hypothetical protein GWP08_03195 [Nitrospiraceae bacterium]|nr:hypothetical protein [Nitrospiraceae bacterium]